jgi:hypothetical protein
MSKLVSPELQLYNLAFMLLLYDLDLCSSIMLYLL